MGLEIKQQQSRKASARLDLLRQELLAPILSIEGHVELLKEQIDDQDCLADLTKIETGFRNQLIPLRCSNVISCCQ